VKLMTTRTMSPDPALNGSALGFYESWINGRRVIGHGGDTLYFHSEVVLLPEQNLGLFVSINTGGEGARTSMALQTAFVSHYFPATLPVIKPPADAKERNQRYAGTYRSLRHSYTKFERVFAAVGRRQSDSDAGWNARHARSAVRQARALDRSRERRVPRRESGPVHRVQGR
jgi:hypothetical protein